MPGPDWAYWVTAAVLGLIGAAALYWSLWGDRSRERRRCPKCWYDMAGVPGLRCPECGAEAKSERELIRARRRWLATVGAAVVLSLAAASGETPTVRRDGWARIVPTYGLLWIQAHASRSLSHDAITELNTRLVHDQLSRSESRRLVEGLVLGVPLIQYREQWPKGMALRVTRNGAFIDSVVLANVTLPSVIVENLTPLQEPSNWRADLEQPNIVTPIVSPDRPEVMGVEVLASVYSKKQLDDGVQTPIWTGKLTLPVHVVELVEDILNPVSTQALTDSVKRSLSMRLLKSEPKWGKLSVTYRTQPFDTDLGLGVRIEFLERGKLVAWSRWFRNSNSSVTDQLVQIEGDIGRLMTAASVTPDWTVRVKGDGESALWVWNAKRYWAGEYELPLSDLLAPSVTNDKR